MSRIRGVLDAAEASGMVMVLDVHNYGRYYGWVIGADNELGPYFADA